MSLVWGLVAMSGVGGGSTGVERGGVQLGVGVQRMGESLSVSIPWSFWGTVSSIPALDVWEGAEPSWVVVSVAQATDEVFSYCSAGAYCRGLVYSVT